MSIHQHPTTPLPHVLGDAEAQLPQQILQALSGLRFGSVEVVVHDGKITQIERKEKFRLPA